MRWDPLRGQILRAAHRKCRAWFGTRPARRSVLAALFGAAACYGVLVLTDPAGPGLDPDTMSYLGAAGSLARQGTLRIPMADWHGADSTTHLGHFPPGLSLAVAVPAALGAPLEQAARGVEALAAFGTVALAVWLVASVSGPVAAALAGLVLLETPDLVLDHAAILSEPLFLALMVATVALMTYSKRPLTYSVTAAAASMVRYAGAAVAGAAVLWAFGIEGTLKERLRRAAIAAAPALVLNLLWVMRVHARSDYSPGSTAFVALGESFAELGRTLADWLAPSVPGAVPRVLLSLVAAAGAAAVLRSAGRAAGTGGGRNAAPAAGALPRFFAAAGLVASCYAALVLFSRLVVDARIPFDERILSPLILLAEIAVVAALGVAWRGWGKRARAAAVVLVASWMAGTASSASDVVTDVMDNGWDYGSPEWRNAPVGEWLRTRANQAEIFSNNPAIVWFLTGRASRRLPATLAPDSVRAFDRAVAGRRWVLVEFPFYYEEMAGPDSLALRLGLHREVVTSKGVVWQK